MHLLILIVRDSSAKSLGVFSTSGWGFFNSRFYSDQIISICARWERPPKILYQVENSLLFKVLRSTFWYRNKPRAAPQGDASMRQISAPFPVDDAAPTRWGRVGRARRNLSNNNRRFLTACCCTFEQVSHNNKKHGLGQYENTWWRYISIHTYGRVARRFITLLLPRNAAALIVFFREIRRGWVCFFWSCYHLDKVVTFYGGFRACGA